MSKQEAERLADALDGYPSEHLLPETREAAAKLRQWPDGKVAAYQYLYEGTYGPVWRNDDALWNGQKPTASRQLYSAPTDQSARIAELERQRDALLEALQDLLSTMDDDPDASDVDRVVLKLESAIKAAGGGK